MGHQFTQINSQISLLLLGILSSIFSTGPCPVHGVALRIVEHTLPFSPAVAIPPKKLVKRPHGQGWRGPDGFFFASRRTRQCLPAFGWLPIEDCIQVITDTLPPADDIKRQWWHKPSSRATDKPNVQMPIERTYGKCTLKITPLYPISAIINDPTVSDWDTATWRQIHNIGIALAHGCPGGDSGWGGFQQAGDHGNLMISLYDKTKADQEKRRLAEVEMMKALSDPNLTLDELQSLMRSFKVTSLGVGGSCSPRSDNTGQKKCAADNSPAVCSDAYSIDASNCCLGYTFSEKPIESAISLLLLGFQSIAASTLSVGGSAVGWCDPVQIASY
ncbi:MAG: hypothetical protein M1812_004269 [Candelaria pacifica]|nr:MAG: hypothetical protein M1812_004269 [Candelaria pacifica]